MATDLIGKAKRLLSTERGTIYKDPGVGLRAALVYPNRYRVGMANLGFQAVYRLLNQHPRISCERGFLPDPGDEEEFERTSTPLFSLETQTPLSRFDVLAFSVPFEMDYPNVVRILDLARVPVGRDERKETGPLVIAGGSAVSFNPEPLAELVDAFVIGEAEEVVPRLARLLAEHRSERGTLRAEEEVLASLSSLDGVYCPARYEFTFGPGVVVSDIRPLFGAPRTVKRVAARDMDEHFASSVISSREAEFGEMVLAEVSRGCPRRCKFCVTAFCVYPVRNVSPEAFLRRVKETELPKERVGLVGTSLSDYQHLHQVGRELLKMGCRPSLSSLRPDAFDSELAEIVAQAGQETITFAPETASERLQRAIGKRLPRDSLPRALGLAQEKGIRRVKLYFMIGLPGEREEDLRLTAALLGDMRKGFPGLRLSASFSILVPKPFTPFEGVGMAPERELRERLRLLRSLLAGVRGLSFGMESPRQSRLQGMLSLGDRRLGEVLVTAAREGGGRSAWKKALSQAGLSQDGYLAPRPGGQLNPWAVLEMGGRAGNAVFRKP